MSDNDWKKRLGVVYSTNPDFKYENAPAPGDGGGKELSPEQQKLIVGIDRRNRSGKQVTLVSGWSGPEDEMKDLAKTLKTRLGVGGSAKNGEITIQGDFREKLTALLKELGYTRTKRGN